VVFSALAAVVLLAVLLTPRPSTNPADRRLSTHSAGPHGARGLHDAARRLGWRVERLEAPLPTAPRVDVTYAVLAPIRPLTPAEAHHLLQAVRAGAGLLVVPTRGSALADSLGLQPSVSGGVVRPPPRPACAAGAEGPQAITWFDGQVHSWWLVLRRPFAADTVGFVHVRHQPVQVAADGAEDEVPGDSAVSPAALGFTLGRGRVVAVADPDLLRNDVIRVCRWGAGLAAVRMLTWLGDGRPPGEARPLVFDEFHQGFRAGRSGARVAWAALWAAPAGRAALQGAGAALLLLLALGPRPLAPRSRARMQRRSALEHVRALARAYEQVGATRTAARMLARGLRRRHRGAGLAAPPGAGASADESFLAAVGARHPALRADVDHLRAALDHPVDAAMLLEVGQAVARIDDTLRQG
jgi:hypothetical protein